MIVFNIVLLSGSIHVYPTFSPVNYGTRYVCVSYLGGGGAFQIPPKYNTRVSLAYRRLDCNYYARTYEPMPSPESTFLDTVRYAVRLYEMGPR
jgi:hypothetical protein